MEELSKLKLEMGEDGHMKKVSEPEQPEKSEEEEPKKGFFGSMKEGFEEGADKARKKKKMPRVKKASSKVEEPKDELKPEPEKVEPEKVEPETVEPEAIPEPEPEEVESDPEKAEIVPVQSKVAILRATDETHPDGPGKAYRYWDYAERMYILTTNFWVARQSSDLWDVLWVWYQNGAIHHVMTKKEMQRYLP
ncbi:hypothetical protein IJI79_02755 [Candidatus Saccharibacteria bacterium]|nr:hypothetical protein [Candidatus Saccharibacteria bacterium]